MILNLDPRPYVKWLTKKINGPEKFLNDVNNSFLLLLDFWIFARKIMFRSFEK